TGAHTGGVGPMGLGQPAYRAVPFGPSAGAGLQWEPLSHESLEERPARRIHRRCVAQWLFGLRLDLRMTKLLRGPRALCVVTGLAGDGEVAHPIGAVATLGDDMLDLQGDVRRVAVGAFSPPLLQQSGSRAGIAAPQPPQNGS